MKKTVLTSVIALAAIFAGSAYAQTPEGSTSATTTEQTVKGKKEFKKDRGQKPTGEVKHKKLSAFEGIQLNDTQKEALKSLKPKAPERKTEKSDTVSARPDRRKMRADYVNGVKAILTPEQYVIFLENVVVKEARLPFESHHGKMRPAARPQKDGKGPQKDGKRHDKDSKGSRENKERKDK